MERAHENIFSALTLNFPLLLPSLIREGLQSHRVTSDLRQQFSLALERQLSGQLVSNYASSLINIPVTAAAPQGAPQLSSVGALPATFPAKPVAKQHPPLAASNSVANCSAASHLKAAGREHRKLDRSASEPADKSQLQQQLRPVPANSSRYKTELCRPFEESGACKYGDKCQFAHGHHELRTLTRHPKYKTELCRTFHSTGFCPYGPRCHFIHNSDDSRRCLLTTLQPPHSPSQQDCCSFSLGSAGELSPTGTSSSSGSPTSSLGGFFPEDSGHHRVSFSLASPAPPQPAPFFAPEHPLQSPPPSEDEVVSSIDMLVSEMELGGDDPDPPPPTTPSANKLEPTPAVDINRNMIRLPIFSRLSLGSSP